MDDSSKFYRCLNKRKDYETLLNLGTSLSLYPLYTGYCPEKWLEDNHIQIDRKLEFIHKNIEKIAYTLQLVNHTICLSVYLRPSTEEIYIKVDNYVYKIVWKTMSLCGAVSCYGYRIPSPLAPLLNLNSQDIGYMRVKPKID